MKHLKLLPLLAVLCAAALATSCKEDENWNPTWAIPVLKESSLTVADFVSPEMGAEFSAAVNGFWNDYINNQLKVLDNRPDTIQELHNIDSMAYAVLTDTSLHFVEYENGTPKLTDEVVEENNISGEQREQIDEFLNIYYSLLISGGGAHGAAVKGYAVKPKAEDDENVGKGKGAIESLLSGIAENPLNIFPTVATLLEVLPTYKDSINAELDKVLEQATMDELQEADLKSLAQSADGVKRIEVGMDINNSLPFRVAIEANFIDGNNDNSLIHPLLQGGNENLDPSGSNELKPFSIPAINDEELLKDIVSKTTHIQLKVKLTKSEQLTAETLRTLANRGVKFNLRVRVQANMSKLLD
jgi:hypothetical protein